jgi:hypothetical protein
VRSGRRRSLGGMDNSDMVAHMSLVQWRRQRGAGVDGMMVLSRRTTLGKVEVMLSKMMRPGK